MGTMKEVIGMTGEIIPGSISFEGRAKKAKPYDWGFGCTPRVANLRSHVYSKSSVIKDWAEAVSGVGVVRFRKNVRLDVDRARIVTKVFKETDGMPIALRKAEVISRICDEMPIFIKPGELIVGDPNSAPDEVRIFPEIAVSFLPDALEGGFKDMVTPEEKAELLEIHDYWKDKSLEYQIESMLPKEVLPFICRTPTNPCTNADLWNCGRTLMDYDYERLFQDGIKARVAKAEAKLEELKNKVSEMPPSEYMEKKNSWEGMIICGKALIRLACRYAELARQQAQKEVDPVRKKELEEIAAVCEWVPANPPRTFHEALQFFWFNETVGRCEIAGA